MSALSLRDIEEVLKQADPQKRHHTLRAVADLFLSDAPALDETRVGVFDNVFSVLVADSQKGALAELGRRMAPVENAPRGLIKRLAVDSDIAVAGPVLMQSPRLSTEDLCEIARTKGNAHMLAMSARKDLTEPVTDILVQEGDQQVARSVAGNRFAKLSPKGVNTLIERAQSDEAMGACLHDRPEIPRALLTGALPKARARAQQNRDLIAAASRLAESLHKKGGLNDGQIVSFAENGEYESLVSSFAVRTGLRYEIIENLMHSRRISGLVLVCKSLGTSWTALDAVLRFARSRNHIADAEIANAHREFIDLSRATAERIVRFWSLRQSINIAS